MEETAWDMQLQEIASYFVKKQCKDTNQSHLAWNTVQWQAVLKAAMDLSHVNSKDFLDKLMTSSC